MGKRIGDQNDVVAPSEVNFKSALASSESVPTTPQPGHSPRATWIRRPIQRDDFGVRIVVGDCEPLEPVPGRSIEHPPFRPFPGGDKVRGQLSRHRHPWPHHCHFDHAVTAIEGIKWPDAGRRPLRRQPVAREFLIMRQISEIIGGAGEGREHADPKARWPIYSPSEVGLLKRLRRSEEWLHWLCTRLVADNGANARRGWAFGAHCGGNHCQRARQRASCRRASNSGRSDSDLKILTGDLVFPATSWRSSACVSPISRRWQSVRTRGHSSRAYRPELAGSKRKRGGRLWPGPSYNDLAG
jgi:hypothetical protein